MNNPEPTTDPTITITQPSQLRFALATLAIIAILCVVAGTFQKLDVRPVFAINDEPDHSLTHIVALSEGSLRNSTSDIEAPNFVNLRSDQLATLVVLPARQSFRVETRPVSIAAGFHAPSLFVPIPIIVGLSSKEEVSRIAARWIVASMEDVHPIWMTMMNRERHPMRLDLTPVQFHCAMSEVELRADPRPALFLTTFVDVPPEAINRLDRRE